MGSMKEDLRDVNWNKVWPDRMPVILRDLAPTNPFNPRNLWPEEKDSDAAKAAPAAAAATEEALSDAKKGKKPHGKDKDAAGGAKLKKADLIRLQLAKDKLEKQSKVDEEKLSNVKKSTNLLTMKMTTPTGRLKQLYEILKECWKKKEFTDAVDTLWEIQRTQLVPVRSAVGADGRKKVDKQRKAEQEEDDKLRDELHAVHKKYRKYTKLVHAYLENRDLIEFQLTEMSDRLPPLNMHHMNKFILDDWQRTVLGHIDDKHSVIVCAPTSSGKTVLSSYVSVVGGKVLFIVPTDPLAWQVAALFQAMVKGTVALITEGTVFLPDEFKVAVGTPRAVESTLIDIGYDFEYAVYDEVHDLNGAEGDALERIVKAVNCPFLALSATIGNAEKLLSWWKLHHPRPVHLLEYKGRFINLQRMIWHEEQPKSEEEKGKKELVVLHPCAGITLDYLVNEGFESGDLAFTPRDTFALWKAMEQFYPQAKIEDVSPHKFFQLEEEEAAAAKPVASKDSKKDKKSKKDKEKSGSKKKKSKEGDDDDDDDGGEVDLGTRCHRITLMESKRYEDLVKKRLQALAKEEPKATQELLDFFAPSESLRSTLLDVTDGHDINGNSVDVYSLVNQLVQKQLTPSIAFQLDSVRCRQLFDQLLTSVEAAEVARYPLFREKVEAEYAEWEKNQATLKKREAKVKGKDKEDEARETQAFEERPPPDIYAPHPDFVLTPVGYRLSATEFKEIRWQLRRELSEESDDGHPLVRSLRRGIAIYAQNLPAGYLRIVQSLAQAGRLAVVFSDDSLAYGVNMPFRTCIFCEDTSEGVLTSLMVQQMAGRAGRRGLDRQGNLVFAGLSWSRIQFLMRGLLPDVTGRQSLYPTVSLQRLLTPHPDTDTINRIVSHPLYEYMTGTDDGGAEKPSYLAQSVKWMSHMGLLTPDYKLNVDRSVAKLIWECRDDCAEALGIFWITEAIYKEFHHKPGDVIANQLALFNMLLRVVGREKFHPELARAVKLAPLEGQEASWETVSALIKSYEEKLEALGPDAPAELRLRVDLDDPLDGYVFRTIVDNLIPIGLGTFQLDLIKKRLRHVGDRLRLMHNILMYSGRYGMLEEIVRKCFRRIKWILIDSEV
jgi:ATP-dependent RNA helicase DDX60